MPTCAEFSLSPRTVLAGGERGSRLVGATLTRPWRAKQGGPLHFLEASTNVRTGSAPAVGMFATCPGWRRSRPRSSCAPSERPTRWPRPPPAPSSPTSSRPTAGGFIVGLVLLTIVLVAVPLGQRIARRRREAPPKLPAIRSRAHGRRGRGRRDPGGGGPGRRRGAVPHGAGRLGRARCTRCSSGWSTRSCSAAGSKRAPRARTCGPRRSRSTGRVDVEYAGTGTGPNGEPAGAGSRPDPARRLGPARQAAAAAAVAAMRTAARTLPAAVAAALALALPRFPPPPRRTGSTARRRSASRATSSPGRPRSCSIASFVGLAALWSRPRLEEARERVVLHVPRLLDRSAGRSAWRSSAASLRGLRRRAGRPAAQPPACRALRALLGRAGLRSRALRRRLPGLQPVARDRPRDRRARRQRRRALAGAAGLPRAGRPLAGRPRAFSASPRWSSSGQLTSLRAAWPCWRSSMRRSNWMGWPCSASSGGRSEPTRSACTSACSPASRRCTGERAAGDPQPTGGPAGTRGDPRDGRDGLRDDRHHLVRRIARARPPGATRSTSRPASAG